MIMNEKSFAYRRIYPKESLPARRCRGRKRARGSGTQMPRVIAPNQRWFLDFLTDTFGPVANPVSWLANDDRCRDSLAERPPKAWVT